MGVTAAIALGALAGLALGVLVGLTTDVPLAPELGLLLGGAVGWLSRRPARPARAPRARCAGWDRPAMNSADREGL